MNTLSTNFQPHENSFRELVMSSEILVDINPTVTKSGHDANFIVTRGIAGWQQHSNDLLKEGK